MRNDESVLIHIRERDCVAIEAKYHKKCYQKYTKSLSNMTREKAETGPVVYDKAFDLFCVDIVQKRIIDDKEILLLSCLLKRFISYIKEVDGVDVPYQAARLKKRIQTRYPQVVFHSSRTKNKGTLVYSDDIIPGDIADDIMEIDHADDSSDENEIEDGNAAYESSCSIGMRATPDHCEIFHTAMEIRKMLRESKGVDGWPPDANDMTYDLAKESIPAKLFNFIAWTVGYSDEPAMDERIVLSHSQSCKVVSICQDFVYAEGKGRKQTHKALALGMAVRQMTGSTKLINVLHGLDTRFRLPRYANTIRHWLQLVTQLIK